MDIRCCIERVYEMDCITKSKCTKRCVNFFKEGVSFSVFGFFRPLKIKPMIIYVFLVVDKGSKDYIAKVLTSAWLNLFLLTVFYKSHVRLVSVVDVRNIQCQRQSLIN